MNRAGGGPVVQLENPIDINEIMDGKCPNFSIVDDPLVLEEQGEEENTNMVTAFPYEFLETYELEGLTEPDYFKNLKQSMKKLLKNGKIHKKDSIGVENPQIFTIFKPKLFNDEIEESASEKTKKRHTIRRRLDDEELMVYLFDPAWIIEIPIHPFSAHTTSCVNSSFTSTGTRYSGEPTCYHKEEGNTYAICQLLFTKKNFRSRRRTVNISEIQREGSGEIPNYDEQGKKYVVEFYYAAYHEETVDPLPFDVHARPYKRPKAVVLGENSIIQGLEIAIKSMQRGERAMFLVHPYLAYRNGILDRIPPNATILFDVELLNIREWTENDENIDEELPSDYEKTLKKAVRLHEEGNLLKKSNKLLPAVRKYNQANKVILNMRFQNETEEKQAFEKLLTVFSNLAICHWELENYKQVCNQFNSARYVCPSRTYKHIKLLYFSSKALRMLGSYEEAKKRIDLALRESPDQKDLIIEKQTLLRTIESTRKNERDFYKRMLNVENQPKEEAERKVDEHIREGTDALVEDLHRLLDVFLQDDDREIVHNLSFTEEEMQLCRDECSKRKIIIRKEGSTIRFIKTGF